MSADRSATGFRQSALAHGVTSRVAQPAIASHDRQREHAAQREHPSRRGAGFCRRRNQTTIPNCGSRADRPSQPPTRMRSGSEQPASLGQGRQRQPRDGPPRMSISPLAASPRMSTRPTEKLRMQKITVKTAPAIDWPASRADRTREDIEALRRYMTRLSSRFTRQRDTTGRLKPIANLTRRSQLPETFKSDCVAVGVFAVGYSPLGTPPSTACGEGAARNSGSGDRTEARGSTCASRLAGGGRKSARDSGRSWQAGRVR